MTTKERQAAFGLGVAYGAREAAQFAVLKVRKTLRIPISQKEVYRLTEQAVRWGKEKHGADRQPLTKGARHGKPTRTL